MIKLNFQQIASLQQEALNVGEIAGVIVYLTPEESLYYDWQEDYACENFCCACCGCSCWMEEGYDEEGE